MGWIILGIFALGAIGLWAYIFFLDMDNKGWSRILLAVIIIIIIVFLQG